MNPHPDAILELRDSVRGFLPPRVALDSATSPAPLSNPAPGTLVYNTATSGLGQTAVYPGYYYWDGSRWQRLSNNGYAGIILGNEASEHYVLDAQVPGAECTGAWITLPPGKWVVHLVEVIHIAEDSVGGKSPCYIWVRATLGDGLCTQGTKVANIASVMTADRIAGGLISGAIGNNWQFGLVTGSIVVHNNGVTNKTYSVWAHIQPSCVLGNDGSGANDGLLDFMGPSWGETQFYAIPMN